MSTESTTSTHASAASSSLSSSSPISSASTVATVSLNPDGSVKEAKRPQSMKDEEEEEYEKKEEVNNDEMKEMVEDDDDDDEDYEEVDENADKDESEEEEEEDTLNDEYIWSTPPLSTPNPLSAPLTSLDSSLRCPICHDLYTIPVTLSTCGHSFCSECIRKCLRSGVKSMKREAKCPSCRMVICGDYEAVIVPNRGLEGVVRRFGEVRGLLRKELVALAKLRKRRSGGGGGGGGGERKKRKKRGGNDVNSRKKRKKDASHKPTPNHTEATPPPPSPTKRKRKRPVAYHHLKKKQLQALCAAESLSTRGTEQELKDRHADFIILYNAECDAEVPRSVEELVAEIGRREKARKEEILQSMHNGSTSHKVHMQNLKASREKLGKTTTTSTKVSSGNTAFDTALNNGFSKLIQEARKKGIASKHKQKRVTDNENEEEDEVRMNGVDTMKNGGKKDVKSSAAASSSLSKKAHTTAPLVQNGRISSTTTPSYNQSSFNTQSTPSIAVPNQEELHSRHEKIMSRMKNDFCSTATTSTSTTLSLPTYKSRNVTRGKSNHSSTYTNASGSSSSSSPSIIGPWSCSNCTFYNVKNTWSTAECEMCGNSRKSGVGGDGGSKRSGDIVEIDC